MSHRNKTHRRCQGESTPRKFQVWLVGISARSFKRGLRSRAVYFSGMAFHLIQQRIGERRVLKCKAIA